MKVWLIGDEDRAEMRPIVDWLAARTAPGDLRRSRMLAITGASFAEPQSSPGHPRMENENTMPHWHPDLVIVLESHPDEYSVSEVMQLFAVVPVSRIVCCAGAWSESAGRTRKIWPLGVRVAAVEALPRLAREWELLTGRQTDFHLPPTAGREEWFAAQHPAMSGDKSRLELTVRIISPDPAYRQMLVDLLTQQGMTMAGQGTTSVDAILWDADPWEQHRLPELRKFTDLGPVIALSGWVTSDLQQELMQAGVQTVVPKLGDQARLLECLWSVAIAAAEP